MDDNIKAMPTNEDVLSRLNQLEDDIKEAIGRNVPNQPNLPNPPNPPSQDGGYLTKFHAGIASIIALIGITITIWGMSFTFADRVSKVEYYEQTSIEDRHMLHTQLDSSRDSINLSNTSINAAINIINTRLTHIETLLSEPRK